MWTELPRPVSAGAEPVGYVGLGYARASTARQSLDVQLDSLSEAGMMRVFSEKISTRATRRPEPGGAVELAGELKASDVGRDFLTGELEGSHDPSSIVLTVLAVLSGMASEYIRDRTLEGHESARKRGKTIGGAGVTDESILFRVPSPTRPGDEPARHRQAARHHHGREEGLAPLARRRYADFAKRAHGGQELMDRGGLLLAALYKLAQDR